MIAAPNTPPEVVETVVKQAEAGEKVSHKEVKRLIQEVKHLIAPSFSNGRRS
jgi:hypothetical protein